MYSHLQMSIDKNEFLRNFDVSIAVIKLTDSFEIFIQSTCQWSIVWICFCTLHDLQ